MECIVELAKGARAELRQVPVHISVKLKSWVDLVERRGLMAARRIPGYRDEALKGARVGQRSIRLSRSYRAIYTITSSGGFQRVRIEAVNTHDY